MECKPEFIELMHKYLDGDLRKDEERELRGHLEICGPCQKHFHELSRTITLIQSTEHMEAPVDFSQNVMRNLPTEKRHMKFVRWYKNHPIITVAAIFFLFLFGSMFSMWDRDGELVVSKRDNLIIQGDTVIVPEGVTVVGDLYVKNGNLQIEGQIDGDVTLINGKLIVNQEDTNDGDTEFLLAHTGVNGEFNQINEWLGWVWYKIKTLFENVFSLTIDHVGLLLEESSQ